MAEKTTTRIKIYSSSDRSRMIKAREERMELRRQVAKKYIAKTREKYIKNNQPTLYPVSILWLSRASIIVCLLFILVLVVDLFLPNKVVADRVVGRELNSITSMGQLFSKTVIYTENFSIPLEKREFNLIKKNDQLLIETSPLLSIVKKIIRPGSKFGQSFEPEYNIYNYMLFLPIALFVICLFCLEKLFTKTPDLQLVISSVLFLVVCFLNI